MDDSLLAPDAFLVGDLDDVVTEVQVGGGGGLLEEDGAAKRGRQEGQHGLLGVGEQGGVKRGEDGGSHGQGGFGAGDAGLGLEAGQEV